MKVDFTYLSLLRCLGASRETALRRRIFRGVEVSLTSIPEFGATVHKHGQTLVCSSAGQNHHHNQRASRAAGVLLTRFEVCDDGKTAHERFPGENVTQHRLGNSFSCGRMACAGMSRHPRRSSSCETGGRKVRKRETENVGIEVLCTGSLSATAEERR